MSTNLPAIARLVPASAEPTSLTPAAPERMSDCAPLDPPAAEQRWSRAKQVAFLQHLSACHSVAAAARAVGMSRQSAYRLRARLKGQPFDRAWAAAFDCAFNMLAQAAMERAIHGVEVPYFHKGELVHVGRRFDEGLTLGLLRMRQQLLPLPAERHTPAARHSRTDFPGLLSRVEQGPDQWDA